MKSAIETAKKPTGPEGTATLQRMNQSHESLTLWAMDLLQGDFSTILDVGCGGGATLSRLLHKYPQATVYGVDYSSEGVALSKEYNQEWLGSRCHIQEGSVLDLPYENQQFSLITAFETVYFWQDYATAFGEIRRVLDKNGIFLVCCEMSDPTNPRWKDALPWMALHTGEEWKQLLLQHGFSKVTLHQGEGEWITLMVQV